MNISESARMAGRTLWPISEGKKWQLEAIQRAIDSEVAKVAYRPEATDMPAGFVPGEELGFDGLPRQPEAAYPQMKVEKR